MSCRIFLTLILIFGGANRDTYTECLTFMEITEQNSGSYLGFIDGQTFIFINEQNYKKKFEEY